MKYLQLISLLLAATLSTLGITSCSSDDESLTKRESPAIKDNQSIDEFFDIKPFTKEELAAILSDDHSDWIECEIEYITDPDSIEALIAKDQRQKGRIEERTIVPLHVSYRNRLYHVNFTYRSVEVYYESENVECLPTVFCEEGSLRINFGGETDEKIIKARYARIKDNEMQVNITYNHTDDNGNTSKRNITFRATIEYNQARIIDKSE